MFRFMFSLILQIYKVMLKGLLKIMPYIFAFSTIYSVILLMQESAHMSDIITAIILMLMVNYFVWNRFKNKFRKVNYDSLTGEEFEDFCVSLLKANGFYNVSKTKSSGDHGIDVLATKNGKRYAIQCKRYSNNIGNKAVQEAYSGKDIYGSDVAVVMTNQYFTKQAVNDASALNVQLWDRDKLTQLINSGGNNGRITSVFNKLQKIKIIAILCLILFVGMIIYILLDLFGPVMTLKVIFLYVAVFLIVKSILKAILNFCKTKFNVERENKTKNEIETHIEPEQEFSKINEQESKKKYSESFIEYYATECNFYTEKEERENEYNKRCELIKDSSEIIKIVWHEINSVFLSFDVIVCFLDIEVDINKILYCIVPENGTRVKTVLSYKKEIELALGTSIEMELLPDRRCIGIIIPIDYIVNKKMFDKV